MIRKFSILLILFALIMPLFAPKPSHAVDADLAQLRIAATIALEAGAAGEKWRTPMKNVATVIQTRHQEQKGKASWSEILYGGKYWFERSRGFASKTKEELLIYIQQKTGNNWQYALQLAQMAKNHALTPLKDSTGKVANGFMRDYSGKKAKNHMGSLGPYLFSDSSGHDFFNTQTGDIHKIAFTYSLGKGKGRAKIDMKGLSETSPRQSTDWNEPAIDKLIARGKKSGTAPSAANVDAQSVASGGSSSGGGSAAGEESSDGSSGSSGAYAEPTEKARQCSFDEMQKLYMDAGEDACWYCNVVVILTNAYLKSAGKALGSAKELGKLILKLGFSVWLALYILQQVSSFAPIASSKIIQEILLMSFKVALAYLAVDAAETVIVTYFLNPIGQLGVDYGGALFDKLTT